MLYYRSLLICTNKEYMRIVSASISSSSKNTIPPQRNNIAHSRNKYGTPFSDDLN